MMGKRFTDEQITCALRQTEGGTPVAEMCRQSGVSEASFYLWKKKYGKLGMTEIRELRQLRDENARLKRLVAELTLDKHILGEVVRTKLWGQRAAARWSAGFMNATTWPSVDHVDRRGSESARGTPSARHAASRRCDNGYGRSRTPVRGLGICAST